MNCWMNCSSGGLLNGALVFYALLFIISGNLLYTELASLTISLTVSAVTETNIERGFSLSQSPLNIVTSLLRRNTREEKPSHIEQTFKDLKTKNPKAVAARQGEAITTEGLFQFSLAGSWRRQRYLTTTRGGKVRFNTYEARAKVFIHTLTTQQTWRPGSPFRS